MSKPKQGKRAKHFTESSLLIFDYLHIFKNNWKINLHKCTFWRRLYEEKCHYLRQYRHTNLFGLTSGGGLRIFIPAHIRIIAQGRVIRKPVNVNPGFNVNWSIKFSCLKMFFTSNVLCSLRLPQLKTEGQTV